MAKKKKRKPVGEATRRRINLQQYKQELEKMKENPEYRPKAGRKMKEIQKKIEKLERK